MPHPKIVQQVTFLYTADFKKSIDFYENLLELDLVLDQGACRIYLTGPNAFIGFCTRSDVIPEPNAVIFTLVSPQVDEWHQFLQEKGVQIEKAPVHNPTYNIYHFFVRDPNGYLIEIQQFLDQNWPAAL